MARTHLMIIVAALTLAACPDENKKLGLGSNCDDDSQCASGACIAGMCLDPEQDDDGDGLINRIEGALGTNPQSSDTDGDGVTDFDEVGDTNAPIDSDGDDRPDAIEPSNGDADSDCIADQFDPNDSEPETDPAELAKAVCNREGECALAGATASCPSGATEAVCDYLGIDSYEASEITCDGKDNDCNGQIDEPFKAGGTITFDGIAPADQGKVLGDACGAGACAGGEVVCSETGEALTCSTNGAIGLAACSGDGDCNGIDDVAQVANPLTEDMVGCTDFYTDSDNDTFGTGDAHCLCVAAAPYDAPAGGDCEPERKDIYPGAPGLCGEDADCDGSDVDADEGCDDTANGRTDYGDGCYECVVTERSLGTLGRYAGYPQVGNLEGGGWVVGYDEGDNTQQEQTFGRVLAFFDANGKLLKRIEGLGFSNANPDYRWTLVTLRGGGMIYGEWRVQTLTQDRGFYAQRYSNVGEPIGKELALIPNHPSGSYLFTLVALAPGAYAYVGVTDQGEIETRYIDANDTITPVPNLIDPGEWSVDGFADGTMIMKGGRGGESFLQRIAADGTLDGEQIPIVLPEPEYLRDASVRALDGGGWILFTLAERYDAEQTQFSVVAYQKYTAAGLPDGARVVLTNNDTDGCPYDVLGDVDSAGQAFAMVYDGECGSRTRGWYEVGGEVVFLDLQTERYPDGDRADLDGNGLPIFVFVGEDDFNGFNEILLRRYTTDGEALYVPESVR